MSQIMTLEEMRQQYPGEWVLVACTEMDDAMNPIQGEVIAHSCDRDVIDHEIAVQRQSRIGTLAIEYVGDVPEDWAAIL